jgi:hypothetical protein
MQERAHLGAMAAAANFLHHEVQDAVKHLESDARQAWRALEAIDRLRELGAPIEDEQALGEKLRAHIAARHATA